MPDGITPDIQQAAVTSPQPASTPIEPVDERGVPWKNVVAEFKRKAEEAEARERDAVLLNLEYQKRLGAQVQAQQQPPASPESQFDDTTTNYIRKIAQQVGYELITRAQTVQEASDPEIQKEAAAEFQAMSYNPYYATWTQDQREQLAVARAKASVAAKRAQAGQQSQTQAAMQAAAQAQAQAASLPPTTPNLNAPGANKDAFIKEFTADPQQHRYLRLMYKLDPQSKQGQDKLRAVAEEAWKGSAVDGSLAQAVEFVSKGGTR